MIEPKKPPPKVTGPKVTTKKHPTWPETFTEVAQAVEEVVKKAGEPVPASASHNHLGPDRKKAQKLFEKHRGQLVTDGIIHGLPE